jgi:translation initiation factor 1
MRRNLRPLMAKRRKDSDGDGMVYSTNPGFSLADVLRDAMGDEEPVAQSDQRVYVSLDRKNRGGKPVTLVEGLRLPGEELDALGKELKTQCGVGGSVKEDTILIQGDQCDRVVRALQLKGFQVKRKGG